MYLIPKSFRAFRVGCFYETSNNDEKLLANKKFGLTFTRDLADSIFSIALATTEDTNPRKFFYQEIDKFNLLNPDKKIPYLQKNKNTSLTSLNLDYYLLYNLYKNERGIFGLKTKIFLKNSPSDVRVLNFSCLLSRQVIDSIDFALKFKFREIRGPELNSEQLNHFKSLV